MVFKAIVKDIKGKVDFDVPLRDFTSISIGGLAKAVVEPVDIEDVRRVIDFSRNEDVPLLFLGNGTNVLIVDEGFPGVVVRVAPNFGEYWVEDGSIVAEAGVSLHELIKISQNEGLSGLEFAIGIPGSLGGAIWINAGANSHSIGDIVEKVDVITQDLEYKSFSKDEIGFGYRRTVFQERPDFIWKVYLKLREASPEEIKNNILEFAERRKSQPANLPSAGCIFKNPPGNYAGKLIELAGCKGLRVGGAVVSSEHANFIVNRGDATSTDVLKLIEIIREKVRRDFGVELELEIDIKGRGSRI